MLAEFDQTQVMQVFQASPVSSSLGELEFGPVARAFLEPLSDMIRLSAQRLDASDQAMYSINAITAMQVLCVCVCFFLYSTFRVCVFRPCLGYFN